MFTEVYSPWNNSKEGSMVGFETLARKKNTVQKLPSRIWTYLIKYYRDLCNVTAMDITQINCSTLD